ncbi:LysR family transcriptional regulator [Motiliproteus sediminis]|uniref:LysR family transcriptional regulator n=1 Tax=Motiliproteus sediminis TaxID=1468178 RepID=UPI001AF0006A|nr:LysR family transcriptional regulator [Motiliproteus sediminis]
MDSHNLSAFVSVAELASFSLAAEQLHLTQPAVSKRIANLEEQLNCRLFDRIGRKVALTEAGQTLLPRARRILQEIDDSCRLLGNLGGSVSGRLTLATSHHISLHRLPPMLRRYRNQYPEVELEIDFTESELAYEAVLQGHAELAIITMAPAPHPQIESCTLWLDRLRYVVATDHPLAQQQISGLADLTRYRAILPGPATFTRQLVEQRFSEAGLNLDVAMSTNYLDTIRMMVSIGFGWSLLPETLIDSSLTEIPLEAAPITRPLGCIHHRERTLSNAAKALIYELQQQCDT